MTDKLKSAADMALEAMLDVQDMMNTSDWFNERVDALRQALAEWTPDDTAYRPNGLSQDSDQLPDATKMIEWVCVRYWVQDTMESGRWVTTDPMSKSKAKLLLSETYRNAFEQGEIVELPEMPVDRGAWDDVSDATKWVDELRGDEAPRREWVGLTNEEREDLWQSHIKPLWGDMKGISPTLFACKVEAKLKEKNNG